LQPAKRTGLSLEMLVLSASIGAVLITKLILAVGPALDLALWRQIFKGKNMHQDRPQVGKSRSKEERPDDKKERTTERKERTTRRKEPAAPCDCHMLNQVPGTHPRQLRQPPAGQCYRSTPAFPALRLRSSTAISDPDQNQSLAAFPRMSMSFLFPPLISRPPSLTPPT